MKKASLLLLFGVLVSVWACRKDEDPKAPRESDLTGEKVDVTGIPSGIRKVFLLNEGGLGSNNASLDILRISDGNYITGVFRKMNPEAGAGLGDVGNDIAVQGDEVWMTVNNSGIVEVVSAENEKEIAAIRIPTPRNLAFDSEYAYVTSWSGAYAAGSYDDTGNYKISDYKNPKGRVYRIGLKSKKVEGSVEVGYQPEGLACRDGKLYVANSGGISSQLPPDYAYDNSVSVIDTRSFKLSKTIRVQVNLKNIYSDGAGNIYVTSLGNFWDIHSGLYKIGSDDAVSHIADYVSVSSLCDGTIYCIGTEDEFNWGAEKTWKAWACKDGGKYELSLPVRAATPYSLCAVNGDCFLIGDAGDYFNPGSVSLYSRGTQAWSVTAGVCPGHFAVW